MVFAPFYPSGLLGKLEGFFELAVAVVIFVQRLGQSRSCLGLAGSFERVADIVQLIGVVAVVVEHIAHERESLFGRELGRVAVLVVMAGDVLVRVLVAVLPAAPAPLRGSSACRRCARGCADGSDVHDRDRVHVRAWGTLLS